MKLEECVRAVITVVTKRSASSVRGKFSRLREVLVVITAEGGTSSLQSDSFVHLTEGEIHALLTLRSDLRQRLNAEYADQMTRFSEL
jgi:hypothetical protein